MLNVEEGHVILVSESTHRAAGTEDLGAEPVGPLAIRGRGNSIEIYRLHP